MRRLLFIGIALALLMAGCSSSRAVVEGTHFAFGAYLPWDGSLYGVELLQFTNGTAFSFGTNGVVQYEREYTATNSYLWGMIETHEWSKSKVKTTPNENYSPTIH